MRLTRRVLINLVTFGVVALVLIAYGVFDLLGNPFRSTTTVSAVLPSASGLTTNFSVTYDGIVVGSVSRITAVPGGARITMSVDPSQHVPADVAARVVIGNDLGQQEVALVPRPADPTAAGRADPPGRRRQTLHSGQVLPVAANPEPASIGQVVAEATRIIDAIPPGQLNDLLHQAALAVNGQADNLRTIASASAAFSQEFLAYQQQFQALLANSPPVLDTVTANAQPLQQGLADTAAVLAELAAKRQDLTELLNVGSTAATDLNQFVVGNRANLGCLVHDLGALSANAAQPTNLANLGTFLQTNNEFFTIVGKVAPPGPARALTSSDHARTDQVQLRQRLLLPPQQPPAVQYSSPKTLTPIRPGAACDTAEFGPGVGAVSQPGFAPADGGTVVPPTAAEAHVSGGGPLPPTPTDASLSGNRVPVRGGSLWPLLVALVGSIGVMLGTGRRRAVRAARPEPVHGLALSVPRGGARRARGRRAGRRMTGRR